MHVCTRMCVCVYVLAPIRVQSWNRRSDLSGCWLKPPCHKMHTAQACWPGTRLYVTGLQLARPAWHLSVAPAVYAQVCGVQLSTEWQGGSAVLGGCGHACQAVSWERSGSSLSRWGTGEESRYVPGRGQNTASVGSRGYSGCETAGQNHHQSTQKPGPMFIISHSLQKPREVTWQISLWLLHRKKREETQLQISPGRLSCWAPVRPAPGSGPQSLLLHIVPLRAAPADEHTQKGDARNTEPLWAELE